MSKINTYILVSKLVPLIALALVIIGVAGIFNGGEPELKEKKKTSARVVPIEPTPIVGVLEHSEIPIDPVIMVESEHERVRVFYANGTKSNFKNVTFEEAKLEFPDFVRVRGRASRGQAGKIMVDKNWACYDKAEEIVQVQNWEQKIIKPSVRLKQLTIHLLDECSE